MKNLFKIKNKVGGIREYIISYALVGLFIFCLIAFSINLAIDNGSTNSIINNGAINKSFGDLNQTLLNFKSQSDAQLNATSAEVPSNAFGSLVLYSIVGAGWKFINTVTGVFGILISLLQSVLGVPPIAIYIFMGIILVSVIFFAWRMIRIGS